MSYRPTRLVLVIALPAALAFSALSGRTWYSIALAIFLGFALVAWTVTHRTEVLQAYAERLRRGEEAVRERGLRGSELNPAIVVGLLAICALAMIAATYTDHSNAHVRGFLRPLLYALLGPELTTVMAAIFATLFAIMALENGLGAYWSRKT